MKKYAKQTAFLLWTTCLVSANISGAVASQGSALSISGAPEELVLSPGSASLRVFSNAAGEIRSGDGRGWQVTDSQTLGASAGGAVGGARVVFAVNDMSLASQEQQMRGTHKSTDLLGTTKGLSENESRYLASATEELLQFYATTDIRYLGVRDWVGVLTSVTDGESLKPFIDFSRSIQHHQGSFDMTNPVNQALSAIPGLIVRIRTLYNSPDFKEVLEADTNHFLHPLIDISNDCKKLIEYTKNVGKVKLPSDSEKILLSVDNVFLSDAIKASVQLGKLLEMINKGQVFTDTLSRFDSIKRNVDAAGMPGGLIPIVLFVKGAFAGDGKGPLTKKIEAIPQVYEWESKKHPIFASFLESVNMLNKLLGSIQGYQQNVHDIQFSRAAAATATKAAASHLSLAGGGAAAIEHSAVSSQPFAVSSAADDGSAGVVSLHHDLDFLSLGKAKLSELQRKERLAVRNFADESPASLVSFLVKDIKAVEDLVRKPIPQFFVLS